MSDTIFDQFRAQLSRSLASGQELKDLLAAMIDFMEALDDRVAEGDDYLDDRINRTNVRVDYIDSRIDGLQGR